MNTLNKPSPEFLREKQKVLYWLAFWTGFEEHVENLNLDLPDLSILLQIMGWEEATENITNRNYQNVLKIELECNASGIKKTFIKQTSVCKCPTNKKLGQVHGWDVTGSGPSISSQKGTSSPTQSLKPTVPVEKVELISHILAKMFNIINDKESVDKDFDNFSESAIVSRYHSLETLKDTSNHEISVAIESPAHTSTPAVNHTNNYAKDLEDIKNYVEEKLKKIKNNRTNPGKKRISNIKPEGSKMNNQLPVTPKTKVSSRSQKTVVRTPLSFRTPVTLPSVQKINNNCVRKTAFVSQSTKGVSKLNKAANSKFKSKLGLNCAKTDASGVAKSAKKKK